MSPIWIGFLLLICALLALDLGLLHKNPHAITMREAGKMTALWVTVGLSFSGVVYWIYGSPTMSAQLMGDQGSQLAPLEAAMLYLTGYLLEESLSIDNLFVMAMIFESLRIPHRQRHRLLFWGILGAIVMRGIMIGVGVWLVEQFSWVFYVFGAYLAIVGLKLLRSTHGQDEAPNEDSTPAMRVMRALFRVSTEDHGPKFMVRTDKGLAFTKLAVALVAVETADVVFALDSIPAVLSITTDPFLVFTSNIFAIMGLRSLYFVLDAMLGRFRYLNVALAFILIFIGAKMLGHGMIHIPHWGSLVFIVVALLGGVGGSILWPEQKLERRTYAMPGAGEAYIKAAKQEAPAPPSFGEQDPDEDAAK
jgi:tellurite resistance protein TerC